MCGYFIGIAKFVKLWFELKFLHANYTTMSEVFHDFKNLPNPPILKRREIQYGKTK